MRELDPPADAIASQDSDEVLRLWVADGDSDVNLFYGMFGDNEPRVWGMLLADMAAHMAHAIQMQKPELTSDEVFAIIEAGFRERLAHNPTLTGSFYSQQFQ